MADKIHLHRAPQLGSGYDGITFAMSIEAVAKRLDIWPFARVPAARPQALGECTYRQYHLGKDGIFEDLAWRGEAVVMTFKNGGGFFWAQAGREKSLGCASAAGLGNSGAR